MAGYSGTRLSKKLGIKEGGRVALLNAPDDFAGSLSDLPCEVTVCEELSSRCSFDVVLWFTTNKTELQRRFSHIARRLTEAGGLWIAWPKRASGMETDLDENVIREIGLDAGLVDNKVCAIDQMWSGLRFVVRLRDRRQDR